LDKPILFSRHAIEVAAERDLALDWAMEVVRQPDWVEPDPLDPTVERRFGVLSHRDGKYLRVACRETSDAFFVISFFLDRKARRPR